MTEHSPEPYVAQVVQEPLDPELEDAKANNLMGLALFGVFLLLFGGTFVVALLYLYFD